MEFQLPPNFDFVETGELLNNDIVSAEEVLRNRDQILEESHQNIENHMDMENTVESVAPINLKYYSITEPPVLPNSEYHSLTALTESTYQYKINLHQVTFEEIEKIICCYGFKIEILKVSWGNRLDAWRLRLFMQMATIYCRKLNELYLYSESAHDHERAISHWILIGLSMFFPLLEHLHLECLSECICGENGYKDHKIGIILDELNIKKLTLCGFHLGEIGFQIIADKAPKLEVLNYHAKFGWDSEHGWFNRNIICYDELAKLRYLKELNIQDYRWFRAVNLINDLAVYGARIETLTLKREMGPYLEWEKDILRSIRRLRTIKKLKMSNLTVQQSHFNGLASDLPELTEFEFGIVIRGVTFENILNGLQNAEMLETMNITRWIDFKGVTREDKNRVSNFLRTRSHDLGCTINLPGSAKLSYLNQRMTSTNLNRSM